MHLNTRKENLALPMLYNTITREYMPDPKVEGLIVPPSTACELNGPEDSDGFAGSDDEEEEDDPGLANVGGAGTGG